MPSALRLSLAALAVLVSLSGCVVVRDPVLTAGPTFGRDSEGEIGMPRVRVGGFAGVQTRYASLEVGAEAGRLHSTIVHVTEGPSSVRETHLQTYLNATATLTPEEGLFPRLYLLASARRYATSSWLTDTEEYGLDPDYGRGHTASVALNGGAGLAYGPVAIEALTPLAQSSSRDLPAIALRARVSLPILRLSER